MTKTGKTHHPQKRTNIVFFCVCLKKQANPNKQHFQCLDAKFDCMVLSLHHRKHFICHNNKRILEIYFVCHRHAPTKQQTNKQTNKQTTKQN